MPELRSNPLTKKWVVIATERAKRPDSYVCVRREEEPGKLCPFCLGNEGMTPPETFAYREANSLPDGPGWQVRVVPNKFPAFIRGNNFDLKQGPLYSTASAIGEQEVIIHAPDHVNDLGTLPEEQVTLVLEAYKERYCALCVNKNIKYILFVVNHGKEAGASIAHPHSQLFAIPLTPEVVENEIKNSYEFYKENGECSLCSMIKEELKKKERMVVETEKFVSFVPFAATVPFEVLLAPKNHKAQFELYSKEEIKELAYILKKTLNLLYKKLNDPPFNYYLHTSPCCQNISFYHWHFEILPKLTTMAGFEMGTGIIINPVLPEEAARFLREK